MTSLRLVDLLKAKETLFIMAQAAQEIPAPADRTHEMQAEAVDVGFGSSRELWELGMAADAYPHAMSVRLEYVKEMP